MRAWLSLTNWARVAPYAPLVVRLVFGYHLVWVAGGVLLSANRLQAYAAELAGYGIPMPMLSALASAAVECIGGVLLIVGLWVRPAGLLLMFNFGVALLTAHLHDTYAKYYPALHLLAIGVYALLQGAGPWSCDAWLAGRQRR